MNSPASKPNKKALLQNSVGGLNLAEPVRLNHVIASHLPEIDSKAVAVPVNEPTLSAAPSARPSSSASIAEKTESSDDSGTTRQCHAMPLSEDHAVTESRLDPQKTLESQGPESRRDPVSKEQSHAMTVSGNDSVNPRQSQEMPLSPKSTNRKGPPPSDDKADRRRSPSILRPGVLKPRDNFCAVPNVLLNQGGLFENPYDFMVYLHLFSKSYGYGRNTCDMGLNELVEYTGIARNSVKKSLDRLVETKWVRMIQDFEYGRVTRKWRVYTPYEQGKTPSPTFFDGNESTSENAPAPAAPTTVTTGSPGDTVTSRHCQALTLSGSPDDPLTGSPCDPYINRFKNKFINNSLSPKSELIHRYFSELKPERKREREMQAFGEIRKDFSEEDIESCVQYLLNHGLPGGEACHSPMAYLAFSMNEVLAMVSDLRQIQQRKAESANRKAAEDRLRAEEAAHEQREFEMRERAFNRTFPDAERQEEVIAEICRSEKFPFKGVTARMLAIGAWWERLNRYERMEASG